METITVGMLKAVLEDYDDDLPVVVGSDYGDRAGTIQANALDEPELGQITNSVYSSSGYAIKPSDYDGEEVVLVLNGSIMD